MHKGNQSDSQRNRGGSDKHRHTMSVLEIAPLVGKGCGWA